MIIIVNRYLIKIPLTFLHLDVILYIVTENTEKRPLMHIVFIEPFYSGSHKFFADQLKKYSSHDITLITLEGKHWKWRMYGAAMTLATKFLDLSLKPDMIIVTDMLDLPTFLGSVRRSLDPNVPIINYFHENQLAYPWKEGHKDKAQKRDRHYGMMNYHSAYVSDHVLFNSAYNMTSFLDGLELLLNKMPDYSHTAQLQLLKEKCQVMPLGLELRKTASNMTVIPSDNAPLILWNHRWEHDKNPKVFFDALAHLKSQHIPFRLALVGESYKQIPELFAKAKDLYSEELIHYGYASYDDYVKLLHQADILPVTSNHEFFGISVMEAIHCGATPILPNRLCYPQLYDIENNPEIFYNTTAEFIETLVLLCNSAPLRKSYKKLTDYYDWDSIAPIYDAFFVKTQRQHIPVV